jgi:hypothetical protein
MELKQKYLFSTREFVLTDTEIAVKQKTIKENKEWTVKLDEIGNKIYYHAQPKTPGYIAAAVFGVFIIILTIGFILDKNGKDYNILIINYLIWVPIILFFVLKPAKKEIHIINGKYSLSFYQDKPGKVEVEQFVNTLLKQSKQYILDKYGHVDPDLPEDSQMNILNWLKNSDIISQEKYDELKQEYKMKKLIKNY